MHQTNGDSTISIDQDNIIIASRQDLSQVLEGQIDDIRLWNTARTPSEIQDNMHKALTGNEVGLVGYWPMNEGEGTTVYDKAGSNDGTIHGATWVEI